MHFIKMNGIGNDYVFIDLREENFTANENVIRYLCNRHYGIGSDGVVLLDKSPICTLKMIIFNADGSRAELCGNALRCAALYEYDRMTKKNSHIKIETDAGIKNITISKNNMVTVNMGLPDIKDKMPYMDTDLIGYVTNVGNPHFVVLVKEINELCQKFDQYACEISENRSAFPNRTNVEFAMVNTNINQCFVRVFERGSRETLACGTGATAVYETAYRLKLLQENAVIKLKGGELIFKHNNKGEVLMTGNAKYSFSGEITV